MQNLTIPEGVTEVGDAAFYGSVYLEDLNLPSSMQSIGDNCFALCAKLDKITVNSVTPPIIEAKTFYNVSRNIPIVVPAGSLQNYKDDSYWSEFFNIQELSATSIENLTIASLYTENGRVICSEPFEIYTITGLKITKQNENLPSGIYIVKTGNATQKIIIP